MRPALRRWLLVLLACAWFVGATLAGEPGAIAAVPTPPAEATVVEHLGARVPLDARFRDEAGATVHLGDYFAQRRGRPVLLTLMYHRCPRLCSIVLDGVVHGLRDVAWSVGVDFDVLTVSIDPIDEPAVAAQKRTQVLGRYARASAPAGWHFLLGDERAIRALTGAVGFGWVRDRDTGEIAHPAAIVVLTADGRVARYLYGVDYPARDLELSLWSAAEGKLLATRERLILACWHFDDRAHGYVFVARRFLQLGAGGVLAVVAACLAMLLRRERARRSAEQRGGTAPARRSTPSHKDDPAASASSQQT